jgi:hypothetical protein
MGLWYISFAGNEGFRGATVVEARSVEGAHVEATRRDLNPGGEAAILPVPPGHEEKARAYLNRLVSEGELIADGGKKNVDLPPETQEALSAAAHHICQECNS